MRFDLVPLDELCEASRHHVRSTDPDAAKLPFVGLEHVSAGTGAINFDTDSRVGNQKATAFRFDSRHVLYGKLRPYLNKVATPGFPGRCTTELIPLLPSDNVDRDFLAHLLRRKQTVDFVMASVTGARMPRADMKVLMSMTVPLPPLDEQRRIVGILNRASKVERLRRCATTKLRELESALFVSTFGTAKQIATMFPCKPLREVTEIASGATKGRKIAVQERVQVPYLRVANVQDGFLDLGQMKTIAIRCCEEAKYALAVGDLVLTEGGDIDKLGRAAIWRGELDYCAHQNHVYRVRPNRDLVLTDYLRDLAGSEYGKAYFLSVAKRTTGIASMNKTQLGGLPVPLPPLDLQTRYACLTSKVRSTVSQSEAARAAVAGLSSSLMTTLLGPPERRHRGVVRGTRSPEREVEQGR